MASRTTLFGVGNTGFHVKFTWSMSVKAYSHYDNNMNYELWLLKKLYVAWVGLWYLIHALHKYALRVLMDMNTRRANVRRIEGDNVNEEALQANQALIDPSAMSNAEIMSVFQMLAQAMTSELNRGRDDKQAAPSDTGIDAPKKIRFYDLQARSE
uniref:Gag-pol polyprotein n=1 Tax=Solanum tuberosum TaxID=4113 RepID=M1DD87_SOLTU